MKIGIWQSVSAFPVPSIGDTIPNTTDKNGMSTTCILAMAATVDSSSLAWRNARWPGSGQTSALLSLGLEYENPRGIGSPKHANSTLKALDPASPVSLSTCKPRGPPMSELNFQPRWEGHGKPGNIPVNPVVEQPPPEPCCCLSGGTRLYSS